MRLISSTPSPTVPAGVPAPAPTPPTAAPSPGELLAKMVGVLGQVPVADRARFARAQLLARFTPLVAAFDRIPPARRARTILYVSFTAHMRESRLAAAARLAGWDVFGVCLGQPRYDPAGDFTFHARLDSPLNLVLAAWLFPGVLVHTFALQGDHAALLGRLKPRRLIVDLFDTCAGGTRQPAESQRLEQELLARADGITHRDLRLKRLQRLHSYTLPRHGILIHDPEVPVSPTPRPARVPGEIHVVSAGWVSGGDSSIFRVAQALCAHRVHLHVYLNPLQRRTHPEVQPYFQLQETSPYFHIEESIYGGRYWAMLSSYDFGLSVWEPSIFEEKTTLLTADALSGCGSSRLADYIAVGLGVITSPELNFQHFWARHFASTTVNATRAWLENPRPALEAALRNRRTIDRSPITVAGCATRLGSFYDKVAA